MATVDGFVSQHGVVGHLNAGNLKKEKFVSDFDSGNSGHCDDHFPRAFDPSKLMLLKKKMQQKKAHRMVYHPQLSIDVCDDIFIESNNKVKKKRRKRRKRKKKLSIVSGLTLDIEIMDGVFIPSANSVLTIECVSGISIDSTLLNSGFYSNQNGSVPCIPSIGGASTTTYSTSQSYQFAESDGSCNYSDRNELNSIHGGSVDSTNNNNNNLSFVASIGGRLVCDDNKLAGQDCNLYSVQPADDKFGDLSDNDANDVNSGTVSISSQSGDVCSNDDNDDAVSVRQEILKEDANSSRYQQADFEMTSYQQADLKEIRIASSDSGSMDNEVDPCLELSKVIQSHDGVYFNGKETGFISLVLIAGDIYDYSKKFGHNIGVDISSLQYLQVYLVEDLNSFQLTQLQMDFNCNGNNNNFYSLASFFLDLINKCIQYDYLIGCDYQSLKHLRFLFCDSQCSSKFQSNTFTDPNNNPCSSNNNTNNISINNYSRKANYKRFAYGKRRGRKKRKYKMIHKNKLQNAQFKQFGNNVYCDYAVLPKLVTAPAPRCASVLYK